MNHNLASHTTMYLRNQTFALLTVVLLVVGQLMVVMHAVEHPFYSSDTLCAIYHCAEQHHADVAITNVLTSPAFFLAAQAQFINVADVTIANYLYHSRAPPIS